MGAPPFTWSQLMIPETPSMSDMIRTRMDAIVTSAVSIKKKTHGEAVGFGGRLRCEQISAGRDQFCADNSGRVFVRCSDRDAAVAVGSFSHAPFLSRGRHPELFLAGVDFFFIAGVARQR